jgi:hypothetical protein
LKEHTRLPSASDQDGVTAIRFAVPPEATKNVKIYETIVFKTLDIRQGRKVIPEKKESMK